MKEKFVLAIKGFIMGIANLIPGVSGGTLALTLGIYEDFIGAISHFFKHFKKNVAFLAPVLVGLLISIVVGSKIITESLENYPFATTFFFIGLILGGLPLLFRKVKGKKIDAKNIGIAILTFLLVLALGTFKGSHEVSFTNLNVLDYGLLFLVGAVAAATMVIPGVSGSMVLMLLGYYNPVMETIKEFTHLKNIFGNFLILVPFGLGILLGLVGIAKLLEFLFKRYETQTYYGVLGFVFASILTLLLSVFKVDFKILEVLMGICLLVVGVTIGYKLGDE